MASSTQQVPCVPLLPNEIYAQIFNELDSDLATLKAVSLCCHKFNGLAAPLVHQDYKVDFDSPLGPFMVWKLQNLLAENCRLSRHVRTISVVASELVIQPKFVEKLRELVEKALLLKSFSWDSALTQIPLSIVQAIQRCHPKSELHIKSEFCGRQEETKALVGSSCVVELTIRSINTPEEAENARQVITSCPNLQRLFFKGEFSAVELKPGDKLPTLIELHFPVGAFSPRQYEIWASCAGWSRLDRLHFDIRNENITFFQAFRKKLPNLSVLSISANPPLSGNSALLIDMVKFLETIHNPRSVIFSGLPPNLFPVCAKLYGPRLSGLGFTPPRGMNLAAHARPLELCRNMVNLLNTSLQVGIYDDETYTFLSEIAQLPRLRRVGLVIGIRDSETAEITKKLGDLFSEHGLPQSSNRLVPHRYVDFDDEDRQNPVIYRMINYTRK